MKKYSLKSKNNPNGGHRDVNLRERQLGLDPELHRDHRPDLPCSLHAPEVDTVQEGAAGKPVGDQGPEKISRLKTVPQVLENSSKTDQVERPSRTSR